MENWILRFTLVDRLEQPILIHISRKDGGNPLDLDLLATDGDSAYRGKIRHNKLQKYRSSSYDGSEQEWLDVLQHVLLLNPDTHLPTSVRSNLECACNVQASGEKSILSIILRTRVEDITHKLGSIDLKYSENIEDVDLFSWTNQVLQSRDLLSVKARECEKDVEKAKDTVKALEQQLQDLLHAKDDHETQLLAKFTLLLNEKKLRIRAQQRQLIDQDRPTKSIASKHGTNQKRKRNSTEVSAVGENDSNESEGFQSMEIDQSTNLLSDANRDKTPSTASESDEQPDASENPPNWNKTRSDVPGAIPPRRDLPFPIQSNCLDSNASQMVIDSASKRNAIGRDDSGDGDEDATASDGDDEL